MKIKNVFSLDAAVAIANGSTLAVRDFAVHTAKLFLVVLIGITLAGNVWAYSILSPLSGYVPSPTDTYVAANSGACCFNDEYNGYSTYVMQTFKATGTAPQSLTISVLDNDYSHYRFHLLITSLDMLVANHPGSVLWESSDIEVTSYRETDITVSFSGLSFIKNKQYAWVLDPLVTADGQPSLGGMLWNVGAFTSDPNVPPYGDGQLYTLNTPGNGRAADFSQTWQGHNPLDAAFLIKYNSVPEPASLPLMAVALLALTALLKRNRTNA